MSVKQISVFIENKTGKLAEVTKYIADNNVNMKALSVADTHDFGILRIICENHAVALNVIKDGGYVATETEVIAVEYTYAFLSVKNLGHAYMIFRVDDNEKAKLALNGNFNVVEDTAIF